MSERIGVLFVHGIGEQEPGSTLVEWGEALSSWFDEWGRGAGVWHRYNGLESTEIQKLLTAITAGGLGAAVQSSAHAFADPLLDLDPPQQAKPNHHPYARTHQLLGGTCVFSKVTLAPPTAVSHVPAHGELTIRTFDRAGNVREHPLLLAEAHWADAFPVARYTEFLRWAAAQLPLILQAHLGWGLHQARASRAKTWRARVGRWVEITGWYLLSLLLPVFPILVLALLLLSVPLAIAPFAAARGFARRMQGVVVNVLGDIYVLLDRPARAAAIRERVRASFEWLASRCDGIIVVAHSQGAAVALDFLVDEQPGRARRLITLGSGARKLAHLRFSRQSSEAYGTPSSAWAAVLAPPLLGLVAYGLAQQAIPSYYTSIGLALATVVVFLRTRWRHGSKDWLMDSHQWRHLLGSMPCPWTDLPARGDPVSNGAHVMPSARPYALRLKTSEVQNRGSLISDHTTYWENRAQFVPRVASVIAAAIGFRLDSLTPIDKETLSYAWFARTFRVSYLRLGRTVQWLALLHLLLRGTAYIEQVGARVIATFASLPTEWVPNWLVSIVSALLDLNFGLGRPWLAGAIFFLALTGVALNVWLWVWREIDRWANNRMFARAVDATDGHGTLPPDLLLFGYGVWFVYQIWQTFFRYVPPPPLVSLETGLAALLLVLNLKDIATSIRFIVITLRSMGRQIAARKRPRA